MSELLAALPPRAQPPLAVQILPVDAAAEAAAARRPPLKTILVERLQAGDHARAEQELGRYLSVHRPPEIEARARFYLAQARWFQGRPREALLDLLLARERYYRDVQPWLEACLYRLAEDAPQAR